MSEIKDRNRGSRKERARGKREEERTTGDGQKGDGRTSMTISLRAL